MSVLLRGVRLYGEGERVDVLVGSTTVRSPRSVRGCSSPDPSKKI